MADIAAWLNLTPHFCDVDQETAAMSVASAEKCINRNTSILLVPHPIVNLVDIEGMLWLGKKYNIPVLFDSVEAVYAEYKGKPIGSWGTEVFSVHASKFLNGFEGFLNDVKGLLNGFKGFLNKLQGCFNGLEWFST